MSNRQTADRQTDKWTETREVFLGTLGVMKVEKVYGDLADGLDYNLRCVVVEP